MNVNYLEGKEWRELGIWSQAISLTQLVVSNYALLKFFVLPHRWDKDIYVWGYGMGVGASYLEFRTHILSRRCK